MQDYIYYPLLLYVSGFAERGIEIYVKKDAA